MKILTKASEGRTLTIGQFARAAGVAPRTVTKWFDAGLVKGYRMPGDYASGTVQMGRGDRRIYMDSAVEFLEKLGNKEGIEKLKIPLKRMAVLAIGFSEEGVRRIVIGVVDNEFVSAVLTTENLFMAGAYFATEEPGAIVMNLSSGRQSCKDAVRHLRESGHKVRIIGVLGPDNDERASLFECGFDAVVGPGLDIDAIRDKLIENRAEWKEERKRRKEVSQ